MDRQELQSELRKLERQKEEAMRQHEERLCEISEQQQNALRELNEKRLEQQKQMADARREVDSIMRKANRDETIRYKAACMVIENSRQQLFADYKAQRSDEENNNNLKQE